MSRTVNEVHIIGHAGKDAEIINTSGGKVLTKFSLATGGGKKKDGGNYETDWHRCVAWGEQLAEVGRKVGKGDLVEVIGRISYGSYEKDGRKVYTTDIVCKEIKLDADDFNQDAPRERKAPTNHHEVEITDEDLPF